MKNNNILDLTGGKLDGKNQPTTFTSGESIYSGLMNTKEVESFGGINNAGQISTFGQSKFDKANTSIEDIKADIGQGIVNQNRAESQGFTDKLANNALGFVGTAAASLSGFVSVPVGIFQSLIGEKNPVTGEREHNFRDVYDNAVSRFSDDYFIKKIEEIAPSYYTNAEKNSSNPFKGIIPFTEGSQNFWLNKVGKNLGYTVGAIVGGGGTANTLNYLAKLGNVGKLGEVAAMTEKLIATGIKADKAYVQAINTIGSQARLVDGGIQVMASLGGGLGEASMEALNNRDEFYRNQYDTFVNKFTKENKREPNNEELVSFTTKLKEQADGVGNVSFGINSALLTGGNLIQFGRGFSTLQQEKRNIGRTFLNPKTGLEEAVVLSKGEKMLRNTAKVLKSPLSEMTEEQLQFATEKGTQDYYQKKFDNNGIEIVNGIIGSTMIGLGKAYGTKEGWENGILGFVTGGLSGFTKSGEIRQALKEIGEIDENTKKTIESLNKFNKNNNYGLGNLNYDTMVRDAALQNSKDEHLQTNNTLDWKNDQHEQNVNLVLNRIENGKFDLLQQDYENMLLSKDGDMKSTYGENSKSSEETINKLMKEAESIKKIYDNVNTVFGEKVNSKGEVISGEPMNVLHTLVNMSSQIDNRNNRINKLNERLVTLTNGKVLFTPYTVEMTDAELTQNQIELHKNLKAWREDKTALSQSLIDIQANDKKLTDEKVIEDLHKLHSNKIQLVKNFKDITTKGGLKEVAKQHLKAQIEHQEKVDKQNIEAFEKENLSLKQMQDAYAILPVGKVKTYVANKISKILADEELAKNKELKDKEDLLKNNLANNLVAKEAELTALVPEKAKQYNDFKGTKEQKSKILNDQLTKLNVAIITPTATVEEKKLMQDMINYYQFQLEKLERIEIPVITTTTKDNTLKDNEQPVETITVDNNSNQLNLFLEKLQNINHTNVNSNGIKEIGTTDIKLKENSKEINFLLNELKVGDEIIVSIDTDNASYSQNEKDIDNLPVKIEVNGNPVGYINKMSYLRSELKTTSSLSSFFTGKSQLEVDDFFTNKINDDKFLIETFKLQATEGTQEEIEDETYHNLQHVRNVLLFGRTKSKTPILISEIKESLLKWENKIKQDLIENTKLRQALLNEDKTIDTSKVLKTTVSNISGSSVIFNTDAKGKPIWKNVLDSFKESAILLVRRINGEENELFSAVNGEKVNTQFRDTYKNNTYEQGEVYIGVKQAGGNIIPIKLKSTRLKDSNLAVEVNVKNYINQIGDLLIQGISLKDTRFRNEEKTGLIDKLSEIIVVNRYGEAFEVSKKLKINTDSIEFNYKKNDTEPEQHVEIWYSHLSEDKTTKILNKEPTINVTTINTDGSKTVTTPKYNTLTELLKFQQRSTDFKLLEENKPYKSLVTEKQYPSYKAYLFGEEILQTNVGKLLDEEGNNIGNVFGRGLTPMIVHINSKIENVVKPIEKVEETNKEIQPSTIIELTKNYSDKYQWLYKLADEKGIIFTGLSPIKDANAVYNPATRSFAITTNFEALSIEQKELVIAHEIIHGLLKGKMSDEFKNNLKEFVKNLDAKSDNKEINDILKLINEDVEELITYALTNRIFAEWLNSIKVDGTINESKTLWGKLKEILIKEFKAITGKSKLDELNEILDYTLEISEPKKLTAKEKLANRKNKDNLPKLEKIESSEDRLEKLIKDWEDFEGNEHGKIKIVIENYENSAIASRNLAIKLFGEENVGEINKPSTDSKSNKTWKFTITKPSNLKFEKIAKPFETNSYKSFTTDNFTDSEELHIANIAANAYVRYINNDGGNVKLNQIINKEILPAKKQVIQILINSLSDDATEQQAELLDKAIEELELKNSKLWKKTKSYLLKYNKIKINEVEDIDSIQEEKLNKEWDDTAEYGKNIGENADAQIKELISTISNIDPLSVKIDNEGNVTYTNDTNTLTGIAETLNYNAHYPYIFTQMIGSINKEEMMNRLLRIGMNTNPSYLELRNKLLANENLQTAFFVSFNKQLANRYIETYKKIGDKYQIKMDYGNKNSQPFIIISNEWINRINKNIEADIYDEVYATKYKETLDLLNSQLSDYNKNRLEIFKNTEKLFNLFGIDITDKIIQYNVENKEQQNNITKLDYSTNEEQLYFNNFKDKLKHIEKYIKEKKVNEKLDFPQYKLLNELAKQTQMFRPDKVMNSATTVGGANVYGIQNNSYFSQWTKFKNSLTVEGKAIWDKMIEDYNQDKNLKFSNYLGKLTNDKHFKEHFGFDLYEGSKNLDTNKGQEYAKVNELDWELTKYLHHIQSKVKTKNNPLGITVPILSPSDGGMIFMMETQKIAISDGSFVNGKLSRVSSLWKAVYNTFLTEKERMIIANKKLFSEIKPNNDEVQKNYHYTSLDENNNPIFKDETGKPTGKVFKFQHLDIIENGIQITLDSISGLNNAILNDNFNDELDNKVKDFIDKFIEQQVNEEMKFAEQLEDILKDKYDHIGNLKTMITEFTLNNFIANVEMGELFYDTIHSFKNSDDSNKRAKETIAMGVDSDLEGSFVVATISSIKLPTNTEKTNNEELDIILDLYNSEINDASTFVTLDEYVKRLKGRGKASKYDDLVNRLKNNLPVNELELMDFMNPFKEFYYSNTYDSKVGKMVGTQVKNATIPLLPNFIKGTQLESLNEQMISDEIVQVNVESAEKTGTTQVLKIHNNDGQINIEQLKLLNTVKKEMYYKDLRLQLDVPDHIRDEHNKLATQSKNILTNIKATTKYNVNGSSFTGINIIHHLHDIQHENIKESSDNLLKELGVKFDDKGTPIYNDKGNIDVNIEKLVKVLEKEIEELSDNFQLSIQLKELAGNKILNLPLYYSVMESKWESKLTSLFTNQVTNQKHPGGHATMVSGMFLQVKEGKKKISELTQEAQKIDKNTEGIQWSKEIEVRGDYTLKPMQYNGEGKLVSPAEVLLPAWSKQFFNKDGKVIDIDMLPDSIKTMVGYRIPMETKHSLIVFKVVGFLPSYGGSTIVLPNNFVTQSGADFDIDSIYMMQHNFFKNKEGKFMKVKYNTDKSVVNNSRRARENRMLDIYIGILSNSEHYKEMINPSSFDAITNAKKMIDKIEGNDKININRSTNSGNRAYRNRGLQGKDLKGIFVGTQGFVSIASVAKIQLRKNIAPIQKYSIDDKRLDNIEILKERYKDSIKIDDKYIYIQHDKIGWSTNDDFKNVVGEEITDYSSQLIANVLDIVKFPLPENINTYNSAIMSIFPNIGMPYEEMGLFAKQPILVELSKKHYDSIGITADSTDDNKIIENIKRTYQTKLYELLKSQGLTPIDSYEESIKIEGLINPKRPKKTHTYQGLGYSPNLPTLDEIEKSKFEYPSARDYVNMLKDSKKAPTAKYYIQQLQVLEIYLVYKKTGEAFTDGTKAFSSDKIGAGATIDVTDDLIESIEHATDYVYDTEKIGKTKIQLGARLLIDNEPATKRIYPKLFNISDNRRSAYKILESYLEFSNIRAEKTLSPLFINRVSSVKSLISNIKSNISINSTNKEFLTRKINNFFNGFLLTDLPFFNDINKERILGINSEYNLKLDVRDTDNIEAFKLLSTANKVDLIQNEYVKVSKFGIENDEKLSKNDIHILNYLSTKTDEKQIENKGVQQINFLSNSNIEDTIINTFNKLYHSKNPFFRDLAQDLIKYTYITSGLTFGQNSLGKVIPTNILIGSTIDENNPQGIDVAEHLRKKYIDYNYNYRINFSDLNQTFFQQNVKSNDIVPVAISKKINKIDENGKESKVRDENKPKWYPEKNDIITVSDLMLSKEKRELKEANFIKINVKTNKEFSYILYKRYDGYSNMNSFEKDGIVLYYPISKLEPFEYTQKSYLDKNNIGVNHTEEEYIKIIDNDIHENGFKYENIEKPFNNISEESIDEQIKKCK